MSKVHEIARALAAGALIYVVMAACGNNAAQDTTGGRISEMNEAGSDTASSGWLDALTDPVPEAEAASPPDVATEPCNFVLPDASPSIVWAVHAYPGKTVDELSAVRALAHIPAMPASTDGTSLPGYDYHVAQVQLKDGSAAVYCGGNYDSVRFILPN